MVRKNNYLIQATQASQRFLTYDQQALATKLGLSMDEHWLYATMLGSPYRIRRNTGEIFRRDGEDWNPAGYRETMTLLDLICDSSPSRFLTGRWKPLRDFGHQFHRELLEGQDPWAQRFQDSPDDFRRACRAMQGRPMPQGDIAYAIELFDGLEILVQLWFGDEEFSPSLRFLWDENALQYLKYETMYFAKDLLLDKLAGESGG